MITNDIKENILELSPKLQLELYRFIELLVNQNKDEIKWLKSQIL